LNVSFVDLVRKDSWTPLQALSADHVFSKADLMSWQQNSGCIIVHKFVKKLNGTNDTSECALGLLTTFNTAEVTQSRK